MDKSNDFDSDDDIFFGKLTLKEVKKHIFMGSGLNLRFTTDGRKNITNCNDMKIVETNSGPNMHALISKDHLKSVSDPYFNKQCDKSKLSTIDHTTEGNINKTEKNDIEPCVSSDISKISSSELIDFILNNSQNQKDAELTNEIKINNSSNCTNIVKIGENKGLTEAASQNKKIYNDKLLAVKSSQIKNPLPYMPSANKDNKDAYIKRTPSKSNAYKHIHSPVAAYIKGIQVLTVKHVQPKKNFHNISSIPKPIKPASKNQTSNKENISITPHAHRSTKNISTTISKLPQTSRVNKATSSLQTSVPLSHEKHGPFEKPLSSQLENSCIDLSLNQSEVTVCPENTPLGKS